MALHRDILWIGRQWAVTGYGMQLIDQRLMGDFDIETARLWDEGLIARMRAKAWLNAADFDAALAVARSRHQRSGEALPADAPASPAVVMDVEATTALPPAALDDAQERDGQPPVLLPSPAPQLPDLRIATSGKARFASPWRVWMKRKS